MKGRKQIELTIVFTSALEIMKFTILVEASLLYITMHFFFKTDVQKSFEKWSKFCLSVAEVLKFTITPPPFSQRCFIKNWKGSYQEVENVQLKAHIFNNYGHFGPNLIPNSHPWGHAIYKFGKGLFSPSKYSFSFNKVSIALKNVI